MDKSLKLMDYFAFDCVWLLSKDASAENVFHTQN